MSDLQCAATLVVARHAESLAAALEGRRLAAVYCSDLTPAVQTAEIVAARLGVAVMVSPSLRETPTGSPEDASEVFARHRDQFEEIADLFRGETVLVVVHQRALETVVPALARNITPSWTSDRDLADGESAELDRDADGWLLRRWGSRTLA